MQKLNKLLNRNRVISYGSVIFLLFLSILLQIKQLNKLGTIVLIFTVFTLLLIIALLEIWFRIIKDVYLTVESNKSITPKDISKICMISETVCKRTLTYLQKKEIIEKENDEKTSSE